MPISPPPIQQPVQSPQGIAAVWVRWFGAVATLLNANPYKAPSFESTDADGGIIMVSPNATRYRVTVDNSGSLVVTAL